MPRKKTHEEYIKQIKRIKDKPIVCLGIYSGNHVKILHECIRCHHRWEIEPNAVTSACRGCPKCAKNYSKLSLSWINYLQTTINKEIQNIRIAIILREEKTNADYYH